ncbi:hypothetical protein [Embleya scabrispora]|uniref:hypothetical protein n=1 Tax=Embleya scabrispora TaxID=159449 RepID=UPI0024801F31|nr:hypothetical protein [Embleya scabrispora]
MPAARAAGPHHGRFRRPWPGVRPLARDGAFIVGASPVVGRTPGTILIALADIAEAHGARRVRTTPHHAWEDPTTDWAGGGETEEWDNEGRDNDRPVRVRSGRPVHSALSARAVASMDDEAIYGPVVHRLELAAAPVWA